MTQRKKRLKKKKRRKLSMQDKGPKWAFVPFAKTFQQNVLVLKLSSKMPLF